MILKGLVCPFNIVETKVIRCMPCLTLKTVVLGFACFIPVLVPLKKGKQVLCIAASLGEATSSGKSVS